MMTAKVIKQIMLRAELSGQMLLCKTWHGLDGMGFGGSIHFSSKSLSEEILSIKCDHTML